MQQEFFSKTFPFYGGELRRGKRKTARPLSTRHPLHLVLKSTGQVNLFRHRSEIMCLARRYGKKFGLRIYGLSVQRDHFHFLVRIHRRESYLGFIRALSGAMAKSLGRGLWKFPPFTRVVNWGHDFLGIIKYIAKNEREVYGLQDYEPRKDLYRRYREAS